MADGVDSIDLYAGVEDFGQQDSSDFQDTDLYDDVIISQSSENRRSDEPAKVSPAARTSTPTYTGKRFAVYIGNLTWWTTDQDITDVVTSLGINDLVEIKFYENRVNGQSKGFATVVFGSETSSRKVMDFMQKKELHGQIPVVTPCSRQALNQFEMQARKGEMGLQNGGHAHEFATDANYRNQRSGGGGGQGGGGGRGASPMGRDNSRRNSGGGGGGGGGSRGQRMPHNMSGGGGGPPPHQGPPNMGPQRPPMQGFDMPPNNQMLPRGVGMPPPQGIPPPGMPMQGPPMRQVGPPVGMMPPRPGPPPPGVPGIRGPMLPIVGMPPMQRPEMAWERPPAAFPPVNMGIQRPPMQGMPVAFPPGPTGPPQVGMIPMQRPPVQGPPPPGHPVGLPPPANMGMPPGMMPPQPGPMPPGMHPPVNVGPPMGPPMPVPAPHVNPAFFPPNSQPMPVGVPPIQQGPPVDPYGRPPGTYPPTEAYIRPAPDTRHDPMLPQISDVEFDEILQRNKTVSSSAISRAVQDASAGDYANAIETLVTAISLIKGSKIANDDRCRILITSLQDTLHGIESKSYGQNTKSTSSSSRERRSRSRDRDRDRGEKRSSSSRHRSRSREREYHDRSRDRHYDTDRHRDRDRDRDRDREYRSSRH